MPKKTCHHGTKWDQLLMDCVHSPLRVTSPRPYLVTELSPVKWSTDGSPQYNPAVNPALWISVVVVLNGSILALFLWFIIYRNQTRHSRTTGDPEAPGPRSKTKPAVEADCEAAVVQSEKEAPPSCCHLNGEPQTYFRQEASTYNGAPGCGPLGEVGSVFMCSSQREHAVPLPATELGDAALVTTKTVQCYD